jgi:magnesium-transporting ATPase (P-type)
MALGSMELTRNGVVMSRLNAIEDAAGMTVLCSDKTGTITKNELTVKAVKPMHDHISDMRVLLVAALASRAENQDPTDLAFLKGYAEKLTSGTPKASPHSPRSKLSAVAAYNTIPDLQLPSSVISDAAGNDGISNNDEAIITDGIPLPPVDAVRVSAHDIYSDLHGGVPRRQLSMLSLAAAALAEYTVLHFQPFDATIRRTEAIVEYGPEAARMRFRAIKGALNTIMHLCDTSVIQTNEASKLADEYASKGFRTLAVACTPPVRADHEQLTSDDLRRLRAQRPEFLGVIAVIHLSAPAICYIIS